MSFIYYNANPLRKSRGDCVIRAISKVLGLTWEEVAIDLCMIQIMLCEMQNHDLVWGEYLSLNGFKRGELPRPCPNCITVREFCELYPIGTFVVATGSHVIAAVDGDYFDTDDTGEEVLLYYWERSFVNANI